MEKRDLSLKLDIGNDGIFVVDDVYIKYHLNSDKTLPVVFTFANATLEELTCTLDSIAVEKEICPWGFNLIKNKGVSVISFASIGHASWYRNKSLEPFLHRLRKTLDKLGYHKRKGYGDSMGAFGASAYSDILYIDKLLLLYPVSTLSTDIAPNVKGYPWARKNLDWQKGLIDGADNNAKGYIVYDPLVGDDNYHQSRYSNNFKRVRCPGLEHGCLGALWRSGFLKVLLDDFIFDRESEVNVYRKLVKQIRTTERYFERMCEKVKLNKSRSIVLNYYKSQNLGVRDIKSEIMYHLLKKEVNKAVNLSKELGYPCEHIALFEDVSDFFEKSDTEYALTLVCMTRLFGELKSKLVDKMESLKHKKTPQKKALLQVRNAGLGDVLFQVNQFLWLCEEFEIEPFVDINHMRSLRRNKIANCDLPLLTGLDSAEQLSPDFSLFEEAITYSLKEVLDNINNKTLSEQNIKITFSGECYRLIEPSKLASYQKYYSGEPDCAEWLIIHPTLKEYMKGSSIFQKVMENSKNNTSNVCIHLRRGDVAQSYLNLAAKFLSSTDDVNKIATMHGIFDSKKLLKESIPKGFYNRFSTVGEAIDKYQPFNNKNNKLCVLSDGYTRLAEYLLTYQSSLFTEEFVDKVKLESLLEEELKPLIAMSDVSLIGEGDDLLVESLIEGLSSSVIISSSPSMFQFFINAFDLKVQLESF
jgi:hypothetical protein